MKKIILLFLLVVITQTGFSQGNLNLTPFTLDDYVGTWRYENMATNEILLVKLKKIMRPESSLLPAGECIVGTYSYTKNGTAIVDNMDKFNTEKEDIYSWPIYASYHREEYSDMYRLYMRFQDYIIEKRSWECSLKAVRARTGAQIKWELGEEESIYVDDLYPAPPLGFSVPTNVVLNKVE